MSIYIGFVADLKIDRNVITVSNIHERSNDAYWHSKTPDERLSAIQTDRQAAYGESEASARLQRVLEVSQRSSDR